MLNKNQSKKRNSWKYYTVIPALAAFVILFQVEVVAKERQQNLEIVSNEIKSVNIFKITKKTTDTEFKDLKKDLKSTYNIDLEVSDIKRNSENQLTSLKVDVVYGTQKSQSIQSGDEVIKDFGILVILNKNGTIKAGIKTFEEKAATSKRVSVNDKKNKASKTAVNKNLTSNSETNVNTNSNTNSSTSSTTVIVDKDNNTKVITTTDAGTTVAVSNAAKTNVKTSSPLIILDGIDMSSDFDMNSLPPSSIKSVKVYRSLDAVALFGEKGENGIVEIKTKK